MTKQLEGKRIIVTGGAAGIGAAVVAGYVAEGAKVAAVDLGFEDGTGPDGVIQRKLDVADTPTVGKVFDDVVGELGGLDVLVNVAGIERGGPSEDIPDDDWDAVFEVNAKGTRNTNAVAFKHLKNNGGGAIINFGSRSGIVGVPQQAAYSASKAAVHAWTRAVAQEWAPHNIRVNAVAPAMWTGMYDDYRKRLSEEELAEHDAVMAAQIPLGGKLGDPTTDLVPILVFLASDGSHFMSGQSFPIDGGWLHTR